VDIKQRAVPAYSTAETGQLTVSAKTEQMPPRIVDKATASLPENIQLIANHNDEVQVIEVRLSAHMVIGRKQHPLDRQVDIDLSAYDAQQMGVSRHHAIIQVTRDHIAIKDFNSTNGTYINGYVLKPMFGYSLRHGDVMQLGKLKLTVQFPTA
jgi:pSer/pThr/pTyr-binding forkhead associated (FHA) protein